MSRPSIHHAPVEAAAASRPNTRVREEIDPRHRWDLAPIYASWERWEQGCDELGEQVDRFARLQGTLRDADQGRARASLLEALRLQDDLGQLGHRLWYYPSLSYDQDQRDNAINARRQRVQVLFARWEQAGAWFKPELLELPIERIRAWMDEDQGLDHFRFKLEDLYRRK